ncbi:uncharacterized protein UTRI_10490 [Ustilago trichophora]|uniref:Uncharacterized protein n=1 Tax=Ustilago trichophora TaxID=86804 RepID=A0A5C3E9L4_9BASI|nr:uncharacterized protein UTRI_10490 [Ustilago trichophora]
MLSIGSCHLFVLLILLLSFSGSHATQHKRAVPFTSASLHKRNLGGQFKDWYLSKMTKNYFCTDTGRLVPVDPETGHMLLKGLRKRDFLDTLLGHTHETEKGLCRHASWILLENWSQPIPVTQFLAQYPWMYVDERGQARLKPDYLEWLEQQAAARAANPAAAAAPGGQMRTAPDGTYTGGQVQDGGVGYVPPSYLNTGAGMGTTSGLGQTGFGNGITAGTAAHV